MDSEPALSIARVDFRSVADADRRVAGVSAAGRVVRQLAEAGFGECWLAVSSGEPIGASAMDDIRRLAGAMAVRIGTPAESVRAVRFTCEGLVPAGAKILRDTGKHGDGPVSRWLNRPVSRRISALLLQVPGLRPIHATAGTALLALLMFVALIGGGRGGLVAGGLLFHAASVFDGVDGEVARATFRSSPAGAALDSTIDTATTLLFIAGLAINLGEGAFVLAGWGLGLFLLGLALLGRRARRAGRPLNLDTLKEHYRGRFPRSRLMASFTIVSSRDFFALLFALLILLGMPMAPLYIFAAAASVWILFVASALLPARNVARDAA